MLIWGWRRTVQQLAILTFLCGACGNPASHGLKRAVTKFCLFFIPLFPIHVKYFTECTFCGCTNKVRKEEAVQMQAQHQQPPAMPAPQQYAQHPQGQYPQQPQGQYPQAQYPQQQYPHPQQPQYPQQQYNQPYPPQQHHG